MMKNSKWFVFNLAFCGLGLLMLGAWEVRAADPGPCVCTQDFDPTLCSDGNVYGNSCLATSCAGQTDCVSFPCPTQSGTATLTFGQGVCGLNGLTLENEQVTVSVTNPNLAADPCNAIAIRGVNILHGHHFVGVGSAGASLAADPVVCPVIAPSGVLPGH